MSSLGLELIKNINIEENNFIPEKPHVQFKDTNEIIEPSESSQTDSTTIVNNKNPLFDSEKQINTTEINNIAINGNTTKILHQTNNQDDSIIITKNSSNNQQVNSITKDNQPINSIKEDNIMNIKQPTNYNKYIPNTQTLIFIVILIVIVFIIYKYINANKQLLETEFKKLKEKQNMFKTTE